MSRTDLLVLGVAAVALVSGGRAGVIARVFGWAGVIAGFLLLPRVLPYVNQTFAPASLGRLLTLNVVSSIIIIVGAALLGRVLGRVVRFGVRLTPLSLLDRAAGILLTLGLATIAVSAVLQSAALLPNAVGDDVRRSVAYEWLGETTWGWRQLLPGDLLLPGDVTKTG